MFLMIRLCTQHTSKTDLITGLSDYSNFQIFTGNKTQECNFRICMGLEMSLVQGVSPGIMLSCMALLQHLDMSRHYSAGNGRNGRNLGAFPAQQQLCESHSSIYLPAKAAPMKANVNNLL
ncbi:hypothetical protein NL108_006738 [Boleophthalmus pectinirostris]|nr:hypothetical protein NL108_006738 [Boleophthalmus pectinirostris]